MLTVTTPSIIQPWKEYFSIVSFSSDVSVSTLPPSLEKLSSNLIVPQQPIIFNYFLLNMEDQIISILMAEDQIRSLSHSIMRITDESFQNLYEASDLQISRLLHRL